MADTDRESIPIAHTHWIASPHHHTLEPFVHTHPVPTDPNALNAPVLTHTHPVNLSDAHPLAIDYGTAYFDALYAWCAADRDDPGSAAGMRGGGSGSLPPAPVRVHSHLQLPDVAELAQLTALELEANAVRVNVYAQLIAAAELNIPEASANTDVLEQIAGIAERARLTYLEHFDRTTGDTPGGPG